MRLSPRENVTMALGAVWTNRFRSMLTILGIVIGVMMVAYVALPSRLIGATAAGSRRDKLVASAVSGTLGAVVSAPGYVLGRIGILLLGGWPIVILGVILLAIGFALQAGATGAVKAIKLSARLAAGQVPAPAS